MNQVPYKISPSPIVEAVAEIRFETSISSELLFGRMFGLLNDLLPGTEQLPILQIPLEIQESNPDLKYAAHYRLKNDRFIVGIGKNVLAINRVCTQHEYEDWDEYHDVIERVLRDFQSIGMIETVNRVSVRYMNIVEEGNVSDILNLKIDLFDKTLDNLQNLNLQLKTELEDDMALEFGVGTGGEMTTPEGFIKKGVYIGIEVNKVADVPLEDVLTLFDAQHKQVEKSFFESLNPAFLSTLNPSYHDA